MPDSNVRWLKVQHTPLPKSVNSFSKFYLSNMYTEILALYLSLVCYKHSKKSGFWQGLLTGSSIAD